MIRHKNTTIDVTSRSENVELVARITTVRSMPRNSNFILIMAHEETKGTEEEEEEEEEKEKEKEKEKNNKQTQITNNKKN